MTADDFPLPSCAALAEDIRAELEDGSGIVLLQGLDPSRYSIDQLRLLYAAIARQVGTFVYSNRAGQVMRDIRDVGRDGGRQAVKRYGALPEPEATFLSSYARTLSNGPLRFHTDRCDVVALFCVRQAARGGLSQLCSSPAVHNAILESRPHLCAALYEDLWRSRFGEEDATNKSAYPLPVWGVRDGKFTSHYSRTYVEAAQRRPESEVPRVSDRQWQALDLLAKIAEEQCFEMSFAPGDIQFVNNHVIYHARSAFEDDDKATIGCCCGCGCRCRTAAPSPAITRCCGVLSRPASCAAASAKAAFRCSSHSRSGRPGQLRRLRPQEAAGLKSPARPFATEGCRPTVFGGSRPAFRRMYLHRTHTRRSDLWAGSRLHAPIRPLRELGYVSVLQRISRSPPGGSTRRGTLREL